MPPGDHELRARPAPGAGQKSPSAGGPSSLPNADAPRAQRWAGGRKSRDGDRQFRARVLSGFSCASRRHHPSDPFAERSTPIALLGSRRRELYFFDELDELAVGRGRARDGGDGLDDVFVLEVEVAVELDFGGGGQAALAHDA